MSHSFFLRPGHKSLEYGMSSFGRIGGSSRRRTCGLRELQTGSKKVRGSPSLLLTVQEYLCSKTSFSLRPISSRIVGHDLRTEKARRCLFTLLQLRFRLNMWHEPKIFVSIYLNLLPRGVYV